MAKTDKTVAVAPSADIAAQLMSNIPVEQGYTETQFPRISFVSKDVTEESKVNGKKQIDIVTEAGTFVKEVYDQESKEYVKTELGKTIDVTFVFERKQLKHYSEANGYTSSPIYDTDEDVVPLFRDKKTVYRGTPVELRSKAEFTEIVEGKKKSTLEEQKVLYVLYDGEMHQLTIRGSSSWNFSKYKKTTQIPLVISTLDSEEKENGSNRYNVMTFCAARNLTNDEALEVLEFQNEIKSGIADKNAYFAKFRVEEEEEKVDITAEFKVTPKGIDPKVLLSDGHEM
jgi:hypothetical protein